MLALQRMRVKISKCQIVNLWSLFLGPQHCVLPLSVTLIDTALVIPKSSPSNKTNLTRLRSFLEGIFLLIFTFPEAIIV